MHAYRWTWLTFLGIAALPALMSCGGGAAESSGAAVKDPAPPTSAAAAPAASEEPPKADVKPEQKPESTAQASADPKPPAAAEKSPCPPNMALIPGGAYKMGFLKNEAKISDFCIDMTEATAKDYEACVGEKKCNENFVNCAPESTYKKAGKEDHPMVCVDFQQAIDYCTAQGKRLPSDEEWEWAARGGAEGRLFPWGNDEPKEQVCWSGKGARAGTCSVKEHPAGASAQGVLGFAGNVFEWTTNKQDSKTKDRVGRGGSWRDGLPNMMRVDRPGKFEVTYRCGFLGIRCVTAPLAGGAK